MMGMLWVVFFVALTGSHLGHGLPIGSTPQTYPYDGSGADPEGWGQGGLYAVVPALALLVTAVSLLLGCTWCYRHKDCKPNQGEDNQLFTGNVTHHLQDGRRSNPPDSGFSEPVNNNISEDNNNGPISLREMQNIANNNAAAYIVSENEERNRVSRESVVEFEPLPSGIRVVDPLERYADWFGGEDFSRNRLQYLREIGRGWFGRVVEGEIEDTGTSNTVAVKILNQNASLEDKARFLEEARVYRDVRHENILAFVAKCLQEDPWILIFELCPMDLQQYLIVNRHKMAMLNESGVPLRLMCDVSSALAHLHSRGHLYGNVWSGSVLVRGTCESARAVLGRYVTAVPPCDYPAPEQRRAPGTHTASTDVWSLGTLVWQVCAWGTPPPPPPAAPDLPCVYGAHLYQVMQLCWNPNPEARPTAAQVYALINHLYTTHASADSAQDDGYGSSDFEERWQRLKPNTIPVIDEHVAIVHAPSTSTHFTGSDRELDNSTVQDSLSVDMDTAVSRSSSILSDDKDPLSVQIKSESLTNLHGSLEDVRNIYLTHNEMAVLECHQGNISLDDSREREHDRSDSSVDPWLKDIIAGSQDDVSYYKNVSDVIKNLDNILNSEKTSSSESSHQASPSRDNLSLDCKKDFQMQSSMVKSPGITNFQNILDSGFAKTPELESCEEDDADRDTLGTLSHSFERHSDTISQQTLENLTPDTPNKDFEVFSNIEDQKESFPREDQDKSDKVSEIEQESTLPNDTELPNDNKIVNSDSKIPKLMELCVASIPSVSETNIELLNGTQDCIRSCDNNLAEERTDKEIETKSIDDVVKYNSDSTPVEERTKYEVVTKLNSEKEEIDNVVHVLPKPVCEHMSSAVGEPFVVATEAMTESELTQEVVVPSGISTTNEILESENINEKVVVSDLILREFKESDGSKDTLDIKLTEPVGTEKNPLPQKIAPDSVQNTKHNHETAAVIPKEETEPKVAQVFEEITSMLELSPEKVQNINKEKPMHDETKILKMDTPIEVVKVSPRSERKQSRERETLEQFNDSTVYMDLISSTSETVKDKSIDDNMKDVIKSCLENSRAETAENTCILVKNESTIYMDLPSLVKETDNFLQCERIVSSQNVQIKEICSSTPIASDHSTDNNLENSVKATKPEKPNETDEFSETKVPDYGPGVTVTKLEQRYVPESMSPFESPTKSHHTDTYDENSSVVLGPFENCTLELFKGVKSIESVDLPKEELLAFSSNFSEINLETPSPLRDGNFLNEVPDIIHDDIQFDDLDAVTEMVDKSEPQSISNETDQSSTEKRISPLTPPNSPGIFLASTSQQKYTIVDIDLDPPMGPSNYEDLPKEVDLNQIELQITTKLAMAENENNLNIEYSGPLTVEGVVLDEMEELHESDSGDVAEAYLAGNGGSSPRPTVELDEECVKALRDELELKLPLAQVSNIEPSGSVEWGGGGGSLPPPPDLILSYPGALSPIAEETRQQLSAYESDANWNASTRTDSSESYPEPCNNSTDEVTELPTGLASAFDHSTYTVHSRDRSPDRSPGHSPGRDGSPDRTHTLNRTGNTSKEVTMSADSLNGSPYKKPPSDSPIDDRTYNKNEEERESIEHISQVSPCILSPTDTTHTSPDADNPTAVSTLSKTSAPTDADLSKPTETHCLSKATSIDSWCSNDTLYNVEENFDDLAIDPALPIEFDLKEDENSESSHTLTHDDDKELSRCSTYIVHDGSSERCETFSPDSISANDNCTYTKARAEAAAGNLSALTKSDIDSTKNTQTRDLAYETLMSSHPSYSNCTTELASGLDDVWRLKQPELVRRSPVTDEINITPPNFPAKDNVIDESPHLPAQPCLNKMDSVEISCLHDNLIDGQKMESPENRNVLVEISESPNCQYRNMAPSVTSTPLTDAPGTESVEAIPMLLPYEFRTPDFPATNIPNFQTFLQSAEVRPQDISPKDENGSNQDTEILLEGDSKTLSRISYRDSLAVTDNTPNYSDFENSAVTKPQDVHSRDKSSQSIESGISSEEFRNFENSVRSRPQDLSSVIDASSSLLDSERMYSDMLRSSTSAHKTIQKSSQSMESGISPEEFRNFENSVRSRPQDMSSVIDASSSLLDSERMYSDMLRSSTSAHQTSQKSSQSMESGISSEEFKNFENSVRARPQDLSSVIHASSSLLNSERMYSDILGSSTSAQQTSQTESRVNDYEPTKSLDISPPNDTNLIESQDVGIIGMPNNFYEDLEVEEETEQPHSIIMTERDVLKESPNRTFDSHEALFVDLNHTYDSHGSRQALGNLANGSPDANMTQVNGIDKKEDEIEHKTKLPKVDDLLGSHELKSPREESRPNLTILSAIVAQASPNKSYSNHARDVEQVKCNGNSENYATVEFLNETFEELIESNVDDGDCKDFKKEDFIEETSSQISEIKTPGASEPISGPVKELHEVSEDKMSQSLSELVNEEVTTNGVSEEVDEKVTAVTESFLQNEKKFCQLDAYFPLLSDIRFTGPAAEIMSTSFTQDSPTEPTSPECERDGKSDAVADILKEWDSDSDSHSTNSSSGEFIWKQRGSGGHSGAPGAGSGLSEGSAGSEGSADSGSGSEGDEVEFVPSSWDCRAAPAKSSLRSLETTPDSKKRVVFKRQKYHCVYEYPREVAADKHSPAAYVPDLSTYTEWDARSASEAELGYGQLFGAPAPLDLFPLRSGIAFGADYDEDFFISSSTRPFESLGIMSTTSQFFPGMYVKGALERELPDAPAEPAHAPAPPPCAPAPAPGAPAPPALAGLPTPSLDFTTPDSGVEDITPGSTSTEDDFKSKKMPEVEAPCWRTTDSGSSSESVSPSSPGGEALGGLRHTRDKLKLDLPPSPHLPSPSPRHNRVFSFVLDKPKRHRTDPDASTTPLVMTDETPIVTTSLPLANEEISLPEPTFSTFGKSPPKSEPERSAIVLTEPQEPEAEKPDSKAAEAVKGEGTVLDSGDEDSGIESSSKATLERNKTTPNVS